MGRGRAYVDDDIDESKFKTSEAMNRYKKIFSVQRVTVEREVKFSDFEDLGLRRIFKSRGWLLAMGPSEPANIQIVQEFYSNIPPFFAEQKNPPGLGPFGSCLWDETLHFSSGREYPDSFDVYLRGKVLNFSVSGIAQLLKLARPNPNEKSPSFPGLLVDNLDLKLVKSTLGWNKRVRVLRENRLSDFYKVLNSIVRYNIDPPCHVISSLLSPDRARLLYAIGNNVPIDLATYIFCAICRAAFPTSMPDSLPFTSLITRFAMASHVPVEPTDKLYSPWSPLDNMDIFGYSFTPCSPAVKQPQAVVSHTPNMALITNGVAEHRGEVHPISTHSVIPPSSKQPSAEIMEAEEENNDNLIPNSHACINPLTSTSDLHPNKKAKKDPLEHAAGEVSKLLQEFLASQMKLQLKGEEVLGVVSKIPNLSRLQVFKAVRIILSGNPEEFSLLKSLPDVEKTEWILLLISQSEGKEESLRYAIPSGHGNRVANSFLS
ncbi:unnamed protein product [Prunus armeniaca]